MSSSAWRRIAVFLVFTYALSSIFYIHIASTGKMKMLPVLGLMWCPGVAALLLRLVTQRNLRGTGWGWGATRWQAASYFLVPALALVVYGLTWLTGIGGFSATGLSKQAEPVLPLPLMIGVLATLGFLQGAVFALGEEIGWRGFLVPELARVASFRNTALISGAAWAAYHYPLILFADYNSKAPKWYVLLVFTWMVVAASFVFAWLRLKSGSMWTAVILHASHNLFVQDIFDRLTVDRKLTSYVTTEFGAGLAVAYTAAAWYFWRRREELSQTGETVTAGAAQPAPAAT
ncbi:MAG TPA: type II CAAX endopeptidase family protein [Thermoanaerobaculia bacterium]|jgi:membrane protease YdiL (CAAX protease family)|nr:type II CAAX endopeptidase family protein [Thermoanaerobaculia bacterium]